ncbi:hypothetical protein ACFQNE_04285 [Gordonia phosphorivorans]|uniref:Uncharacterized protein n=1 Tax=Gordonia phosphorivorans TaxID=1056982 RepID=A0ABV6H7T0_9ACTN
MYTANVCGAGRGLPLRLDRLSICDEIDVGENSIDNVQRLKACITGLFPPINLLGLGDVYLK